MNSSLIFKTREDCANYLTQKRNQGIISDSTWKSILKAWSNCQSLEDCQLLAEAVYKEIAVKVCKIPLSYFN